ncbi:MAG: haloacid dehalogenase-like hydrolase [Phycisphaerales bacterium]|nr:haloacid dehalogenase-like hydrolase [Phycisphaerales bacterium]
MPTRRSFVRIACVLFTFTLGLTGAASAADDSREAPDPLPSWNDTPARSAILEFVRVSTTEGSPGFIPPEERIAVFDNDGTLWAEHPMYFQLAFAIDRVKALAPARPDWQDKEPFKSILAGDLKTALADGERAVVEIIMATHAGMTTDEFALAVSDWAASARHPRFDQPYTACVYQPMLELLACLRAGGFKTYIVSGGGVEFMRPWASRVYGIPPEQIIGSSGKTQFELRGGSPVLVKLPQIEFIDDKEGKPAAINNRIGRRPAAAFGNSDGDLAMLQWTAAGDPAHPGRARLAMIIRHTDAQREWAYDRESPIGRLDKALDEATSRGFIVVDMKADWKKVFAFEK